jgi:PKD repeat protein
LNQVPGGCNIDSSSGSRIAFNATGGTTYYFLVSDCCGTGSDGGGDLTFSVQEELTPSNDNFADALLLDTLPTTINLDTTAASVETDEPAPSCVQTAYKTLWYAFTPSETANISAMVFNQSFNSILAIYTGSDLSYLAEVSCRTYGGRLNFNATAGQTYYIQVGSFTEESRGTGSLTLEATPALQVNFYYFPNDPSVRDNIQFCDNSYDPGESGFESFAWDFGDGTTSTENCALHRYTVGGDYTVVHTVTTYDGRTASTSQIVQVSTHDVTITKVDAPDSGRVGQTKTITVTVRNDGNPQPDTVTIELYRSVEGGGFEHIASLTQSVPTSRRGRATKFIFQYTFTAEDAALGKIVFRAVANIDGLRDAFEQDNQLRSQVTTIRRPASYPNYP